MKAAWVIFLALGLVLNVIGLMLKPDFISYIGALCCAAALIYEALT